MSNHKWRLVSNKDGSLNVESAITLLVNLMESDAWRDLIVPELQRQQSQIRRALLSLPDDLPQDRDSYAKHGRLAYEQQFALHQLEVFATLPERLLRELKQAPPDAPIASIEVDPYAEGVDPAILDVPDDEVV